MLKFIPIATVSKDFFELLEKTKRQKTTLSMTKLIIVSIICFVVIAFYALWVNQASTRGYYLKQEQKKYDTLVFQRSVIQLDTLQLERKLYATILQWRSNRYDNEKRRVVVRIGKPVEELPVIIDTGRAVLHTAVIIASYFGNCFVQVFAVWLLCFLLSRWYNWKDIF
jgi:predicted PurR-regulated permease PerM